VAALPCPRGHRTHAPPPASQHSVASDGRSGGTSRTAGGGGTHALLLASQHSFASDGRSGGTSRTAGGGGGAELGGACGRDERGSRRFSTARAWRLMGETRTDPHRTDHITSWLDPTAGRLTSDVDIVPACLLQIRYEKILQHHNSIHQITKGVRTKLLISNPNKKQEGDKWITHG
jgi:hypothetical protein